VIEIMHWRDPDGACTVEVWVDGVKEDDANVEVADVDPGRGWTREDWDEAIAVAKADLAASPEFRQAHIEALEANADSEFID
jgi:hypothetical protein